MENLDQVKIIMQMHEDSILKFVKMNFELVNARIDNISKEVSDIQASLNFTDNVNNEKIKSIQLNMQELKSSVATIGESKDDASGNPEELRQIKAKVNDLENRTRRNNIRIDGIQENEKESWAETESKVQSIIRNDLGIVEDVTIERAHRSGDLRKARERNRPRTIIAKLLNFKSKEQILQKARENKISKKHIYINEDFSEITMRQRKQMEDAAKKIRDMGNYATVRYDKLITTPPIGWVNRKTQALNNSVIHDDQEH